MNAAIRVDPSWLSSEPYCHLIDGESRGSGSAHAIVDPSTGEEPASWVEATSSEVDDAIASARQSFDKGTWKRKSNAARADVLEACAARIRQDAKRLATLEALDTGKAVGGAVNERLGDLESHLVAIVLQLQEFLDQFAPVLVGVFKHVNESLEHVTGDGGEAIDLRLD